MGAVPRPGDVVDLGLGYVAVWTRAGFGAPLRPVIMDQRTHELPSTSAEQALLHELVLSALEDVMVPGGVTAGAWQKAAADVPLRTFYRARARLIGRGLVENVGTERQPRYIPTRERRPHEESAAHDRHHADQVTDDGT